MTRLKELAEEGQAGAQAALSLLANPERLLSVTQIGVTLASLGLGWAGEDTLYSMIVAAFQPVITPFTANVLHGASFVLAFMVMTYFHVVVGEVVPKNLAIDSADRLAVAVAPGLLIFSPPSFDTSSARSVHYPGTPRAHCPYKKLLRRASRRTRDSEA